MSTTCSGNGMAFFPANFMLQTQQPHHNDNEHGHHHGHGHPSTQSLSSLLPSCSPHHQDHSYHGGAGAGVELSMLGKRSMSFPVGLEMCHDHHPEDPTAPNGIGIGIGGGGGGGGDEDLSDDGSQLLGGSGEKKRRLNMEQVKTLEKNFELGNKLEPERKVQLAKALGLKPRQIAIWFQNRRARWKTKQLEKDYDVLKRQFDALKSDNDSLLSQNQKLQAEILALKNGGTNREPTESFSLNLNKENTEGSANSSNRSENSSQLHHINDHHIKLDILRSTPPPPMSTTTLDDHHQRQNSPLSGARHHHHHHPTAGMPLFPPSSSSSPIRPPQPLHHEDNNIGPHHHLQLQMSQQFFHPSSVRTTVDHLQHCHPGHQQSNVKEENGGYTNMFVGIDDQTNFWPWLEQPNFNGV